MENISVSIRIRPLNKQEAQEGFAWRVEGNTVYQFDPSTQKEAVRDTKYSLDHIFGPELSTQQLYDATTKSLIQKVINGFNSTVFAYGQTSSGKTFTMRGSAQEPGLIPLAVQETFKLIDEDQEREFLLRVSYMEVRWCAS